MVHESTTHVLRTCACNLTNMVQCVVESVVQLYIDIMSAQGSHRRWNVWGLVAVSTSDFKRYAWHMLNTCLHTCLHTCLCTCPHMSAHMSAHMFYFLAYTTTSSIVAVVAQSSPWPHGQQGQSSPYTTTSSIVAVICSLSNLMRSSSAHHIECSTCARASARAREFARARARRRYRAAGLRHQ